MPRYLVYGSYTVDGVKGVLQEGGSQRRQAVEQAMQSLGGRLETFYFAFGENDFYATYELPDSVSAVALSLIVNATGAAKLTTIPLVTTEEVDEAIQRGGNYRPPGA